MTLESFGIPPDILASLKNLSVSNNELLQFKAFPLIMSGEDVLDRTENTLIKIASFATPIIMKTDLREHNIQALIIVPTRELAQQIKGVFEVLGKNRSIKVALLVGGEAPTEQILQLQDGCHFVVGTPGRIKEFMDIGRLNLSGTRFVIIEEADRLADLEFIDDVSSIMNKLPKTRQTILFMDRDNPLVYNIAKKFLRKPLPNILRFLQYYVELSEELKVSFVLRTISRAEGGIFLIVARNQRELENLDEEIYGMGYNGDVFNVGLEKNYTDIVNIFQKKANAVLLSTIEVSLRLDLKNLDHLVLLAPPKSIEEYEIYLNYGCEKDPVGLLFTLASPQESFQHILKVYSYIEKLNPRVPLGGSLQKPIRPKHRVQK